MVTLTEQELMALDMFVAEHWAKFQAIAKDYLDESEMESLSDKLKGKMTTEIKMAPLPKYGDLMTVQDFVDCVKDGGFIPDDGSGEWATATEVFKGTNVWNGLKSKPASATHVVWFNK